MDTIAGLVGQKR